MAEKRRLYLLSTRKSPVWAYALAMHKSALLLPLSLLFSLATLPPAMAARFVLNDGDAVIGELQLVPANQGDTLIRLARAHNLGYQAIVQANHATDRWLPPVGVPVVLPTQFVLPGHSRKGLQINLAEMRLYYFPPALPNEVWSFPIGIGREGWQTPVGRTRVHSKIAQPTWTPPASIRREAAEKGVELPINFPPGPDNPLGEYAVRLALPGYLLHGTNRPAGVGMRVSHGCIRLYPEDIAQLFKQISANTPVIIMDKPVKLGWRKDKLFMEVHRPAYPRNQLAGDSLQGSQLRDQISALADTTDIDWQAVTRLMQSANGVPAQIGILKASQPVRSNTQPRKSAAPSSQPEASTPENSTLHVTEPDNREEYSEGWLVPRR